MSNTLISVKDVAHFFGEKKALDKINLEVAAGESVLLLGKNGAGKSTLLALMAGLFSPSFGQIENKVYKENIFYLGVESQIYPSLSALDNLLFWAKLYGLSGGFRKRRKLSSMALSVLEQSGLLPVAWERAETLSRGMLQRLSLARIFLFKPLVLLLDEPFSGLDVEYAANLRVVLRDFSKSRASLVFASHHSEEDLLCADRILVLQDGRLFWSGAVKDFSENKSIINDGTTKVLQGS